MALDMGEDNSIRIRKAYFFTPFLYPVNKIWDSVLMVWAGEIFLKRKNAQFFQTYRVK